MLAMCASTVLRAIDSRSPMAWFDRPSAIKARTSRSRSVRSSSGTRAAPADEHGDDGGIDDRAALGDPPDGVGEVVEIRDPVLEQVADPAGSVAHQAQRERRLDMLGQDEDADGCPMLRADRLRGAKALVGVGRRHPDVHDRDVRKVLAGRPQEVVGVADLSDHLEARVDQDARDAFAHEHGVVGKDEPQGHPRSTSARMAAPEIRSFGMKPRACPLVRRRP